MPTPTGVWAEYTPAHALTDHTETPVAPDTIVRVFSSELTAWRAAGPAGNRVVFVGFGETVEQAIARETPPPAGDYLTGPDAPAPVPRSKRRAASERVIDLEAMPDEVETDDGTGA